jgi:hypothetical protein
VALNVTTSAGSKILSYFVARQAPLFAQGPQQRDGKHAVAYADFQHRKARLDIGVNDYLADIFSKNGLRCPREVWHQFGNSGPEDAKSRRGAVSGYAALGCADDFVGPEYGAANGHAMAGTQLLEVASALGVDEYYTVSVVER